MLRQWKKYIHIATTRGIALRIAQITTARELAILNARSFFAHRANQERKKSGEEEIGLARYILRIYTIVGFISAALLALALIFLAASVPAPGALAGAVIGITSAIVSLGSMGSDLSSMAAGSNAIDIYRKFISSAQPEQKNPVADTFPLGILLSSIQKLIHSLLKTSISLSVPGR